MMLDSTELFEASAKRPLLLIGAGLLVAASCAGAGKVAKVRRKMLCLEREANTDYLTGLLNRRASENRLEEEFDRARRETDRFPAHDPHRRSLLLVTADLDNLKRVNDSFGHEAGDLYLQAFARLARENLRAEDWAGRLGGDEFVMALRETNGETHDKAQAVVNRLVELTRNTIVQVPGGHSVTLSASFGVARYTSGGEVRLSHSGPFELYGQADLALPQAKREGKGRVVYA